EVAVGCASRDPFCLQKKLRRNEKFPPEANPTDTMNPWRLPNQHARPEVRARANSSSAVLWPRFPGRGIYFSTASFNALEGRNRTTVLALILICSPVCGLRPM